MANYYAVYARNFGRDYEECDTFDDAVSFLRSGADAGELFQVCIVGPDGKVFVEHSPTFDVSGDVPKILKGLKIPFSAERGEFVL